MKQNHPRLMLAAPSSGGGKTTLASALLAALAARGLRPAAFKCGPDYIDPMFHREALGVPGRNLDLFLTPAETVGALFCRGAAGADISVMEGAMGYYDGVGATDEASAWHLAVTTRTPSILILHPRGALLSVAALVKGFLDFRRDSMIRGVVLNRCRASYAEKLSQCIEAEAGVRVYGHLPEMPEAAFESRHLGLTVPDAAQTARDKILRVAREMEKTVDIPGLIELAQSAPAIAGGFPPLPRADGASVTLAVARDEAFCFHYQENFELLEALGARLAFFSPMRDTELPEGTGGLYLGGGYPELHAAALAANVSIRRCIKAAVIAGMPTVAECGGFLYLQSRLRDADGCGHDMVGALAGVGSDAGGLRRFGYIRLRARRDTLLCDAGDIIPAHEFHHWDCDIPGDAFAAVKASGDAGWNCVVANATLFAGFPHLYFWSRPGMAARFVAAAARYAGGVACSD